MKKDEPFSEAAELYAANIETVEQMKEIYEADLKAFVDKVVERVRAKLKPAQLCHTEKNSWLDLWIGKDCEKEGKEQGGTSFGFSNKQREIISKRRLDVNIYSSGQQFNELVTHPDFTPVSKRTGNTYFAVQIDLRSGDAVEVAAARLVKMLQAIEASYSARSK